MGQALLNDCPICRKQTHEKYRPFCSARCADVDLGRWLNEAYTVPTGEAAEDEAPFDAEKDA